jgi:hypothetical protein
MKSRSRRPRSCRRPHTTNPLFLPVNFRRRAIQPRSGPPLKTSVALPRNNAQQVYLPRPRLSQSLLPPLHPTVKVGTRKAQPSGRYSLYATTAANTSDRRLIAGNYKTTISRVNLARTTHATNNCSNRSRPQVGLFSNPLNA